MTEPPVAQGQCLGSVLDDPQRLRAPHLPPEHITLYGGPARPELPHPHRLLLA
ncbi:hypothetical protein ACUXZZ_41650 [Streptomyces graminifolii]|uniref:hypothetical protein n=1 Tax=Streptomyces graminifolii TaxID=1266771 RepID=UPI004057E2AA